MNRKLWTKVLASLIVMTLTFTNFIMLGVYGSKALAAEDTLENQETVTNNENVSFDAYFKDENGKITHTIREDINKQDLQLYVSVEVKRGYLKNATVQVLGENNTQSNLNLKNSDEAEYIETIEEATNTINLKQLNGGTQIVLEVPVSASKEEAYNLSNFSMLNDIILTGTYVGDNGKETKITKTIQTKNEWSGTASSVLEQQVIRFIPYTVGSNSGTILQTLVTSGIQDNTLPIEETNITITVPTVNGKSPVSVNVTTNGTLSTNGQSRESFTKDNWTYENGTLTINVKNVANNNTISWLKNLKDEFVVTYIYDEKVDTLVATQNAVSEIKAYNSVETKLTANNELTIEQDEVLGQIVSGSITTTEAVSKGYLYANSEKQTIYNEKVTLDVAYPELVDELSIVQDMDYFVNENGDINPTTVGNANYTYYKTVKISKANFENILGEDGALKITSLNGDEITTINKDTQTDEDGNYVYEFTQKVNQIKVETTKPLEIGKLEINYEKVLEGKTDYSKTQVESFKTLQAVASIEAKAENTTITKATLSNDITLIAPTTKMEVSTSNENLSTVVTNENVELRVTLRTDDISCDLFKNPTVEIVLPNYISKLNIKDINLLFDDELSIKDYNTYINDNGNIVIKINITGEQTKYSEDEITKGANIIINTDITLKQLTPTTSDVIKAYVTNELVTSYEQTENTKLRSAQTRGYDEALLSAVAPVGIVTTNTVSGYNTQNETVTSISSQAKTGKLDVKKQAQTATVTMSIINNYQNTVNNVKVLGRVLTNGSKDVDTLADYGSNLNSTMASAITLTGINDTNAQIYYSTNVDATKDLTDTANGWTTTPTDLASVKSYLIVMNGDITTGTTISMSYNLNIPANIEYNTQAYSNYVVYFDSVADSETTSEKAVATVVGLASGDGPNLEVSLTSDYDGQDVEEGKIITYIVSVKNVGTSEVKNVKVTGNIPNKTAYVYSNDEDQTYDTENNICKETISSIAVGETKTITYQVKTKNLKVGYDADGNASIMEYDPTTVIKEYDKDGNLISIKDADGNEVITDGYIMQNTATAIVDGYDAEFTSNEVQNKLIQGYVNVAMKVTQIPETYARAEDDEITYQVSVDNVNTLEKKNIVLTTTLPESVIYKEATNNGTYNEQTRTVTWNIDSLLGQESKTYMFTVTVDKLPDNTYEEVINTKATLTGEKTVESNEIAITVQKAKLTIKQSSDTKKEVSVGNTITYNFEIKNEGTADAPIIELIDNLPDGVTYLTAQYSYDGKTYNSKLGSENTAIIKIGGLKAGETLNIAIKATADELADGVNKLEVTNKATVSADAIAEITSNEITNTIVPKSTTSTDDPSIGEEGVQEGTYSISGIAWLDENNDGKRDDNEQRISNIQVVLINAENGQIVKDITTGNDKIQKTNANGEYIFANLVPAKYMVVFLHDSGNYGLTIYKQTGVNDDKNSDAVQMNVVYEGTTRVAGVSDKLSLTENLTNIDIGLIASPKFDLKLDKVITGITVSDSQGTDVYDYKDTKLAKLDLNSKTAVGSTIMIEYKITVTNEGGVAGYAKKIVDYMPSNMKFSSELNKDWYTADNGTNLYNTSLANTLIQPGETKEITLLLTMKVTNSNMGIINNTAEIAESYNDLGLADLDSTPSNKVQNEDDMSSADAIIGTKTGEVYIYITLTFAIIAILGAGIYFIKKKVLTRV